MAKNRIKRFTAMTKGKIKQVLVIIAQKNKTLNLMCEISLIVGYITMKQSLERVSQFETLNSIANISDLNVNSPRQYTIKCSDLRLYVYVSYEVCWAYADSRAPDQDCIQAY